MTQNERHIRILAEEYIKKKELSELYTLDEMTTLMTSDREDYELHPILAAMQRVEEECEMRNKDYAEGFKVERDQWVKNWNHLDKLYEQQQSDLTRLRECEAIVRELAEGDVQLGGLIIDAREWVRKNDSNNQTKEEQP